MGPAIVGRVLVALALTAAAAGRTSAGRSPGTGQRAPAFRAPLLDGGQLELAQLQGKKVVVLDFWASWCGPCVESLPVIADVVREYDGVAFYAVNQEEDEA